MSKGLKIILTVIAVAVVGVAAYVFFIFKGSSGHLALVPGNSAMVGMVDFKSLASKVEMDKLKNLKIWKYVEEQKKKSDKKNPIGDVLKDPSSSGIDPFSKLCFFGIAGAAESPENMQGGAVAHLLSATSFEEMLKKAEIKNPVQDKGTYKCVKVEGSVLIGWTKDAAVLFGGRDSVEAVKGLDKIMTQKESESVLANEAFKKLNEKAFDMAFFINYEYFYAMMKEGLKGNPLYTTDYINAMKGSSMSGTLTFEDKRLAWDMETNIKDKEAFDKVNYFSERGLSADHLKTLSPDKVYAIMALSLNFKKLVEIFKANALIGASISDFKNRFGLSDAELDNLLTGEISLSMIDFNDVIHPQPSPEMAALNTEANGAEGEYPPAYSYSQPKMPTFVLSASTNNLKTVEKLIAGFGIPPSPEGYYSIPLGYMNLNLVETAKGISFTTSKTLAAQLNSQKTFKEPGEPVKTMVSENPMSFYFDLNMKNYPKELLDLMKMGMGDDNYMKFSTVMSNFDSFDMKGNTAKSSAELLFTPGNGNSLMRLLLITDALVPVN